MTRWPSLAIVAGSTVLMQIHSAAFWMGAVGLAGLAWSVMLEAVALYLWWARHAALAVVASGLLIAGPFYHLSAPVAEQLRAAESRARLLALEEQEIAQRAAALTRYQDNSAARVGWAGRIDEAQAALDAARARQRELLTEASAPGWRAYGVMALQAAALLVVMIAQVLAVVRLRQTPAPKGPKPERQPKAAEPEPAITETAVTDFDRLVSRVAERIETADAPGKAIAAGAGVRPADISMIRNHARRKATGQETVSEPAVRKVSAYLDKTITIGARA